MPDIDQDLRYLDAAQVAHPSGTLEGVELCTEEGGKLGSIEGVLVEPSCRCVRYFVVERAAILATRRYLVPADRLARLSAEDRVIHVEGGADDIQRFNPESVRPFTDDDLIQTMFAPTAA
jgi:hypothetical protein